jgi:hypothetical protein
MENTEKLKGPFEDIFKMYSQIGMLENLGLVKEILAEVAPKIFFTYEEDKNILGVYHIYIDNKFSHSVKFENSVNIDKIKAYIQVAELSFKRGCAHVLDKLVDKIAEKTKNE